MMDEMKRELSFHPEIDFIFRDANLNSEKQVVQIQELIDEEIDLLIVSPNEAEPLTTMKIKKQPTQSRKTSIKPTHELV